MRVYLASWFASQQLIRDRANELRAVGIEVTSRWLTEAVKPSIQHDELTNDYLKTTAEYDLEDIQAADCLVVFTPSANDMSLIPVRSWARGGRNFETGYAHALGKEIIVCGARESVFHHLGEIVQFDTWPATYVHLVGRMNVT